MSIPDAPWVGVCREDYYGYDEEDNLACCDNCCEEFDREDLIEIHGETLCRECYNYYYGEEEEEYASSD